MLCLLLCVSGALCYDSPGYHYPSPRRPNQNWNNPPSNVNGFGNHGLQTDSFKTQHTNPWRRTYWSKQNSNSYESGQTGYKPVSGALYYDSPGYHYPSPRRPNQNWSIPPSNVNGFGNHGLQTDSFKTQHTNPWRRTYWSKQNANSYEPGQTGYKPVSGALCYDSPGYHYPSPRRPNQNWSIPPSNVNGFGNHGLQTDSFKTQHTNPWRRTDWSKQNANSYESGQTGYKPGEFSSGLKQDVNSTEDFDYVSTDVNRLDNDKPSRRRPATTRHPPPNQSGPATMSEPVPTLREFYAPSLQYHVGIYTKTFTPYMQICGGSLVKADVALSAAHCFWSDRIGALRAALFAVAAGKLLRPWEIPKETVAQRSDVKDIKIPSRFRGGTTSFQDDIAIVMMTSPFEYAPGVQPVCVSFDLELERRQLKQGSQGTIAGWGLTEANGLPSQRLNFLKLPFVEIDDCLRRAEPSFAKYITSDKICAGDQKTGRALCKGDSGGGLVFKNGAIPYLRGIASTAQRDSNECNAYAIPTFTYVRAHMTFLENHVPYITEGCEALYINETRTMLSMQNDTSPRSQETTNTNLREQSEMDKSFNNDNMQALEQKNAGLKVQPRSYMITRQSQNEQSAKIDQKKNVNGKEQTLEQESGMESTSNTMNRPSLDKDMQNGVQAQMLNVTIESTILNMPQSSTLSKGEMVTVVTTSGSQHAKLVTMSVGSGEREIVTVPADGASSFVCDCACRK